MTDTPNMLAQAIADAQRLLTEQHRDHDRKHRLDERMGTLEHLEKEAVETIKEALLPLIDQLDCDDPTRKMLGIMCEPKQPAALALLVPVLAALGYFLAQAAGAGPSASLSMSSMRKWGSFALDPLMLAQTAVAQRMDGPHAFDRAQDSGVSADKFVDMRLMVQQEPPPGAVQEAFQRRQLDNEGFHAGLIRAGVSDKGREIYDDIKYDRLDPTTILELYRRKIIDDGTAYELMQQTGFNDLDASRVAALRWRPMDLGMAVAAVTQSQITMDQFAELLGQNGVDPGWAQVMFKTAGASPSVQETLELWNRGLIDEATVDKIVLESPIKNEYVPVLKLMRHRFPALEQTTTLMRRKIMTLEEGKDAIRKLGYTPELADKMATYASTSQSGSARNLTVGQMTRLFEMGRWDAGTFTTRLIAAGFDPDEAADIVDIAEEGKAVARIERGANSIGTRYVSWKIDRQEAVTLLDRINVPTATRDEMLEVWDARREAQTLHLTEAFLHKAHKAGAISREDVERRLLAMGYDAVDTAIIMATDFPAAKITTKQRDLTRADHVKRYEQGLITVNELRDALTALGYDADEVTQIIELSDKKLSDKAAKETASNGA